MSNVSFPDTVRRKIDSGSGIIWIYLPPGEERHCVDMLHTLFQGPEPDPTKLRTFNEIAEADKIPCYRWDPIRGASWYSATDDDGEPDATTKALRDPLHALQHIPGASVPTRNGVFIMYDLDTLLNHEPHFGLRRVVQTLSKEAAFNNANCIRSIIILSSTASPHPAIRDYCDVVDFHLPNYDEMAEMFEEVQQASVATDDHNEAAVLTCSDELRDRIIRSLLGTSTNEATRILSYAVACSGGFVDSVCDVIAREKSTVIRKIEGLEYIPNDHIPDAADFAGFDEFLPWLRKRGRAYTRHAQETGQELPRGAVLIGPPGTGKTEIAKAAAAVLGLDLLILDIGALYDKYVGGTEHKIRTVIQMVDAMPSCLLMVDEIDKVFAGAHEASSGDSGVSSRMLSTFLSWLSSRDVTSHATNRTFVMVTMNRTTGVPPELLRPGRFDKVWSTDLPNSKQRQQILEIHLRKRGLDPAAYRKVLTTLSKSATEHFVGAELEEVVRAARADAYDARMTAWETAGCQGRPPTREEVAPTGAELITAADSLIPLATLSGEDIAEIRKFCKKRTKSVSRATTRKTTTSTQRRVAIKDTDPSVN